MNATVEQLLITRIKALSPQQVAEVVDFVEFLAAKSARRAAFDRLLAIAPALEAAGVESMSEDEIAAEVKAARAERRARLTASTSAAVAGGAEFIVSGNSDLPGFGSHQGIGIVSAAEALTAIEVTGKS